MNDGGGAALRGGPTREEVFEAERPRLIGLAYRTLGIYSDAEDVVQDVWIKWASAVGIDDPPAWLTTVTMRAALDRLRARTRRQVDYLGPWLPEPLVVSEDDPQTAVDRADSLTLAFLTMLEELSPDERVTVLLVDVFGEPFSTVADVLGRSEAASRQLAVRARRKLSRAEPAVRADRSHDRAVVDRFMAAIQRGDEAAAAACLHPSATLVSDGGNTRRAARRPILGRSRVARFAAALGARDAPATVAPATVGGLCGVVISTCDDDPIVVAFAIDDGLIQDIRMILNPDKLSNLERPDDGIV